MILIGFGVIVIVAIVVAMNASSKADALARRVRALEKRVAEETEPSGEQQGSGG